ncbi:MAG: hypothetical protein MZV63_20320 [Marinilabiliales bacterium]|nr:hypothetical protein [Marinilabiliales bacterium]
MNFRMPLAAEPQIAVQVVNDTQDHIIGSPCPDGVGFEGGLFISWSLLLSDPVQPAAESCDIYFVSRRTVNIMYVVICQAGFNSRVKEACHELQPAAGSVKSLV